MEKKLFLRKATDDDRHLIFEWANDDTVRQNSFQSDKILWEEHCVWYEKKMHSPDTLFYILVYNDTDAGQIRLEISGDTAQINYSVAKAFRGRGLGKALIDLAEEVLHTERPDVTKIVAEVKEDNIFSKKIFDHSGYQRMYSRYEKVINR